MSRPAELSIRAIAFGLAPGILQASASVWLALGAIGFAIIARVAPGWFERSGPPDPRRGTRRGRDRRGDRRDGLAVTPTA